MSDEVLNIKVTESEIDFIMDLLNEAGERIDSNGQPAFELLHDLMEQAARIDEWDDTDAETQMFTAGVEAREQVKASSRAAERRALNFSARDGQSEIKRVDLWDANDPKNW